MRQQAKPYVVERKPSRKVKPDDRKPSIWGALDAEIAAELRDQEEEDLVAAKKAASPNDGAIEINHHKRDRATKA